MIAIIDYGMGNIHSVQKALQSFGAQTQVSSDPRVIADCQKIVLPGVGAFNDALTELNRKGLSEEIKKQIKNKKLFLGICLGMQLLFARSQESKGVKGLDVLKGEVRRFKNSQDLKVPHMGWNQLRIKNNTCPLLKGIDNDCYVYFCHSYYVDCNQKSDIACTTDYGIDFTSVVWRDNIFGIQFHPEKSQSIGLKILNNFVSL